MWLWRCGFGLWCIVMVTTFPACGKNPCVSLCTLGEEYCGDEGIWLCVQDRKTTCSTWAIQPCSSGQRCVQQGSQAICQGITNSTCTQPEHHKGCVGASISWFDECNQPRSKIVSCPTGQICKQGVCSEPDTSCPAPCSMGEKRCLGKQVEECKKQDATGCMEWVMSSTCLSHQTCDQGVCKDGCSNPCQENTQQCQGGGVSTCSRDNQTGCLVWNTPIPCSAGQSCSAGKCQSSCTTPCTGGTRRCTGSNVEICQQDPQECWIWASQPACPTGQICQQGQCVSSCVNPCQENSKRCSGNTIQICRKDSLGCAQWANEQMCSADKVCSQGGCVLATDPSQRTEQEVCQRWKSDYPNQAQTDFKSGGNCDPGNISQGSLDDAIRRVSLYRWLIGLAPVKENPSYSKNAQSCAILQANNDGPGAGINPHTPPSTWKCYTQVGASTSGQSNLSWGVSHPADTVPQYIADTNTPSLGHRLWILSPKLGQTGFGLATGSGQWRVASCMYVFDSSNSAKSPDFLAFPPAGSVPIQAMGSGSFAVKDWSLTSSVYAVSAVSQVKLIRQSDNDVQTLTPSKINGYGNPSGISWQPRFPKVGERYKVEVGSVLSYSIQFVNCP